MSKIKSLKLILNGKAVNKIDGLIVNNFLVYTVRMLEDPGYGSGFPCYEFVFHSAIKDGDTVDVTLENMAYNPVVFKVNGLKIEPIKKTRIRGLGI